MHLAAFEIMSIGPMFRDMEPPFARMGVRIGVRDQSSQVVNMVDLDIAMTYQGDEDLGSLQTRILAESVRILKAAVEHLDGKTIQSLYETTDADKVETSRLLSAEWAARNPPIETE